MGSVNKQSVREEVERIKAEFDRLSSDKKINSETKMLFQSMFMIINLIVTIQHVRRSKSVIASAAKQSILYKQTEKIIN